MDKSVSIVSLINKNFRVVGVILCIITIATTKGEWEVTASLVC